MEILTIIVDVSVSVIYCKHCHEWSTLIAHIQHTHSSETRHDFLNPVPNGLKQRWAHADFLTGNDLLDSVFDGVELAGFTSQGQYFFVKFSCSLPFCLSLFSFSLPYFYGLALWCWALWTDGVHPDSPSIAMQTF